MSVLQEYTGFLILEQRMGYLKIMLEMTPGQVQEWGLETLWETVQMTLGRGQLFLDYDNIDGVWFPIDHKV